MKKIIMLLVLLISFSFILYPKDKDTILKEKAEFVLESYINYLGGMGDVNNYTYDEREQGFKGKFLELFASTSDVSMCFNDLDPENKTSKTSTAKEYADHVIAWYGQNTGGLNSKFIGAYKFGKPSIKNGLNYIPVYLTKEVRGNYMSRRLHNQKYDLEFRITYKINSAGIISDVKIGSITLNNNTEPNAEKEKEVVISVPIKEDKQKKNIKQILDQIEKNMVYVQGGNFMMGNEDEGNDNDERPTHTVTVSNFHISKYEVTQIQWENVMGDNPSYFKDCNDCPVELVDWNDAQKFVRKLNQMTGKKYRLPTEAEWEYAARGGNKSRNYKYAGSDILANVAWHYDSKSEVTHSVGQKQPNELGLYDMSGNVWEWCQDMYGLRYYSQSENSTNPINLSHDTDRVLCVLRGGSWERYEYYCRSSVRGVDVATQSSNIIGFRLAL